MSLFARRKLDQPLRLSAAPDPSAWGRGVSTALHRLWALAGFTANAQKGVLSAFSEIEARTQLVEQQAQKLEHLTHTLQTDANTRRIQAEQDVQQLTQQTSVQLGHLSQQLNTKVQRIGEVISMIDRTSHELELLALNAKIQAAHAGDHGRAFATVADNMRHLAQSSRKNLASVRTLLDFSELQTQFEGFEGELSQSLDAVAQGLSGTLDKLSEGQHAMSTATHAIRQANQTIPDMLLNSRDALRRQSSTLEPLAHSALQLRGAAVRGPDAYQQCTLKMHWTPSDVLTDVLARGCLRVAIEPSFWGLSFRLHKTDKLQGLDVDYVQAFAHHLGVAIQWVEQPWVECPPLLHAGRTQGEAPADVMWSALLPSTVYHGVVYSEPYLHMNFVLLRRLNDTSVQSLRNTEGRILGCLNDPAVFDFLEQAGVRWSKHGAHEHGIRLANLIAYASMTDLVNALAAGRIDAAPIDGPLAGWTCDGRESPWQGKLESLPGALNDTPWHYAVGVRDDLASLPLLREINQFIRGFSETKERAHLHAHWHVPMLQGRGTYREEPGNLRGEEELAANRLG